MKHVAIKGSDDVSFERDDKTMKIRVVIVVDAIADNVA